MGETAIRFLKCVFLRDNFSKSRVMNSLIALSELKRKGLVLLNVWVMLRARFLERGIYARGFCVQFNQGVCVNNSIGVDGVFKNKRKARR